MEAVKSTKNKLSGLLNTKPKTVQYSQHFMEESFLETGPAFPLVCKPVSQGLVFSEWLKSNRTQVADKLKKYGAILFRQVGLSSIEAFEQVVPYFCEQTMTYTQRSSPRSEVANNIYTSTDHPADQFINMHNELSYASSWPTKIFFFCVKASPIGGETPLSDSRYVLRLLSEQTREKFKQKGVMYLRNLGGGLGLSWQDVFQTTDRNVAEQVCLSNGMTFCWKEDDRLETRWVRPAIRRHPLTGEEVWFNHGFFFNALALDPIVRATIGANDLPFNTFYGDGSPIEESVIEEIRLAFETAKIAFPWRQGDLLVLDNLLMAHGRNPFEGERKIVVAMADPLQ